MGERTSERDMEGDMSKNKSDITSIAQCNDCDERFPFGPGTPTRALGRCPDCGSLRWVRWGIRIDGEERELAPNESLHQLRGGSR